MSSEHLPLGLQQSAGHVPTAPTNRSPSGVKAIAFYLPQFHPIPANNANWGEGFTEWSNVTRAQPEFADHHQPRSPANYGYYDLRVPAIQVRQAQDAKAAGIAAFCYYYYWFDGDKPLILPLLNHRDNSDIDFPFCLCFANENWTKRWDGLDDELIYAQTYGAEFADRFWEDIEPFLSSPKYLRDDEGRPIVLIYRPSIIPQFQEAAVRWRERAKGAGFPELHLVGALAFEAPTRTRGLDSFYEFPPLNCYVVEKFGHLAPKAIVQGRLPHSQTVVHDYRQFVMKERVLHRSPPGVHPAIMPGWDNVARRPFRGHAFSNATPNLFEEWTKRAGKRAAQTPDKLLFVNAWNEWAEGAYLEPDQRHGWAMLSAFARGIESIEEAKDTNSPVAVFVHAHYPEVWAEIRGLIEERIQFPFNLILTTSTDAELAPPRSGFLGRMEVHRVENRGRDILPFLTALDRTKLDFDVAIKLHTKRSPHRVDGALWRQMLINDLLPPGGCKDFVSLFQEDPNIGLISPAAHWAFNQ